MNLGNAIYYILSNDASIKGMVGLNIFPMVAPTNTQFPFIIYDIYNDDPTNDKDGVSTLDQYDVRITAYSEQYTDVARLGDTTRTALDRVATYPSTTYEGIKIQSISFRSQQDEFDSDAGRRGVYRQELQFKIREIRTQ